jgi:hypothetical protein
MGSRLYKEEIYKIFLWFPVFRRIILEIIKFYAIIFLLFTIMRMFALRTRHRAGCPLY